jgi:hypothetical protein
MDNNLTYNPSVTGAITSLTVSADREISSSVSGAFHFVLEQGGNFFEYSSSSVSFTANTYTNFTSSSLTASNFDEICVVSCGTGNFGNVISPTANPNFSSSGSLITLGVVTVGQYANGSATSYFDNLDMDITYTPNPTPVPAALPLFASGLGAMGLFGWRRKRKNGPATRPFDLNT